MLFGHESFGEYLQCFGLLGSSECPHCGEAVDDAEHSVFRCPHWNTKKALLEEFLERPTGLKGIEGLLCGSILINDRPGDRTRFLAVRRLFMDMVESIMLKIETKEREGPRLVRKARTGQGGVGNRQN